MQNLLRAAERVKQNIELYATDLAENQTLTRAALVEVLLNALGWDVHDPALVWPAYKGLADYALLNGEREPVVLVHTVKYGDPSIPALPQVQDSVKYSIITDGNTWLVGKADGSELMRLNLETEATNLLLVKLACLLPQNLLAATEAFFPSVTVINVPFVAPKEKEAAISSLTLPTSSTMSQTNSGFGVQWTPLTELLELTRKPSRLKFPDRSSVYVTSFAAILRETAEWLARNKKLPLPPIIDCYSKSFLLNDQPLDRGGKTFEQSSTLANGWTLNMNYSGRDYSKNALWLIVKAGDDPADYYYC